MKKILIVDDDIDIAELESYLLKKEGYETVIKISGEEALDEIEKTNYDLILMDIMMPGISGIELCAKVREKVDCSIIFVTAKANLIDKMLGFEYGADDYITKPFNILEVKARIKAIIRRNTKTGIKIEEGKVLIKGALKMELDGRRVQSPGEVNLEKDSTIVLATG